MKTIVRCAWAGDAIPPYLAYHDNEWGVPVHDDRTLFEFIVLEGAQAGLSWLTILNKRQGYRNAFRNFDADKVARFTSRDIERLMKNEAIIRNRLKITSTIDNARAVLRVRKEFGSLNDYVWRFVDGKPMQNARASISSVPASTAISDELSKDLKARGFRFVGSTICYAFMQAVGMVNDHTTDCFRWKQLRKS